LAAFVFLDKKLYQVPQKKIRFLLKWLMKQKY